MIKVFRGIKRFKDYATNLGINTRTLDNALRLATHRGRTIYRNSRGVAYSIGLNENGEMEAVISSSEVVRNYRWKVAYS